MNEAENRSSMQALSALADGEADAALAASVSVAWRDDAELRRRWHAYHLIGDVLRSDELAGAGGDAAFLRRLRKRLEQEPVVLAPTPPAEAAAEAPVLRAVNGSPARDGRSGARRWTAPAAVAAGFLVVAGVLTVTRVPVGPETASAPQLTQAEGPAAAVPAARGLVGPVLVAEPAAESALPGNGVLIRDARLDQYLMAHKQFGGSSALGMPAGFLRSATFEGPSAAPGSR